MNAFFETNNGFNFQIIDPLIESTGVRLTWFDCKLGIVEGCHMVYMSLQECRGTLNNIT